MLVTGRNGAGKTNLVEGVHLAAQGFSFRTRSDAQLIRRDATSAAATIEGVRGDVPTAVEVRVGLDRPRRIRLNGAAVGSADELRTEVQALVFTPDRLAVVKGGPAARRAYFDRVLARLLPSRAAIPVEYAATVGQRNAALRRIGHGLSDTDSLVPWTHRVAELGAALVEARHTAIELLAPAFAETAAALGVEPARLVYAGEPPTVDRLDALLRRDLERGTTGAGPHLDDVRVLAGERDLRVFGSQGEQRLAVLSLLLAEARVLAERSAIPPLLLLDDVLSELDAGRRRTLSERLGLVGQTIVTATGAEALPLAPAQVLEVTPGRVREV